MVLSIMNDIDVKFEDIDIEEKKSSYGYSWILY